MTLTIVNRALFRIFVLIAFFVMPLSSAYAQSNSLKVLFIGNSYTFMNEMPSTFEILASKLGKSVHVEHCTKGGASFHEHSTREETYQAIRKEKWDYVVLQGFSRELTFPKEYLDTATLPFVSQIIDSVQHNNECTNMMFFMTWGYENGFAEREEINNYDKMALAVERGYKLLGSTYDIPVVPVGMIWKDVRTNSKVNLYHKDQAHPNKNGSFLIASSFYTAIFDEQIPKRLMRKVKRKDAKIITERTYSYISEHRKEYKLYVDRFLWQMNVSKKSMAELYYLAYMPQAKKLSWDFGDGTSSNNPEGKHIYKQEGQYELKLRVDSPCGIREYKSIIVIPPFKRPRRSRRRKELEGQEEDS